MHTHTHTYIYSHHVHCAGLVVVWVNMAEHIRPPVVKKAKRSSPVHKLTAKERARQFSDDIYEDGGILLSKYCEHSVDYVRVATAKDHLKSKKHCSGKGVAVQQGDVWEAVQLGDVWEAVQLGDVWKTVQLVKAASSPHTSKV